MRKYFTLVCLLWPLFLIAQVDSTSLAYAKNQLEKGRTLRKAATYQEALLLCDSALLVFSRDTLSYDTLMAQTYVEQGLVYKSLQRFEDCKVAMRKSLVIYENAYGFYNKVLVKPLTTIGGNYWKQGNNDMCFYYYNKALAVMDSVANEDDDYWPVLYTNLGTLYYSNYDLDNSALFLNRALAADEERYKEDNVNLLIDHFNLGTTHHASADYENGLLHYKKALDVFTLNGKLDSFYWATVQCNIGDSYFEMEDLSKAHQIYSEALQPILRKEGYNAFKSRAYRAIGKCLKAQKNYKQSIAYFNKSLAAAKEKGGNTTDIVYDCYHYLAKTYGDLGEPQKALGLIDTAFTTAGFDVSKPVFWKNTINKVTLMDGVATKANLLLENYKGGGVKADLLLAQQSGDLGLSIIDSIHLDLKEKGSTQFVTEQFFPVYENAIAISHELFLLDADQRHLNRAFQNAEKCKSNLLLDAVLKSKANGYSKLPKLLLQKELDLKNEIANTERQLYTSVNNEENNDATKVNELKRQLFDLKIELQKLVAYLERDYADYYNLKYKATALNLPTVQHQLANSNTSIIEYFAGDEYFYAMLINADTLELRRLGKVEEIEPMAKKYSKTLTSFRPHIGNMEEHCRLLSSLSFGLYQQLLAPFAPLLEENVVVIPDGILTYLSFDAFIKTQPAEEWELGTYDFLIRHHTISYEHSVELMLEKKKNPKPAAKNQLLAIAPSFNTNYQGEHLRSEDLAPLLHNLKEAETILAFCNGTLLKDKTANRADFLAVAEKYRAIHFATHGKANDQDGAYSYLAFSQNDQNSGDENILFAQDIYNLNLDADLVVLSACETGIGEWKRGEGMISMARAFSYAGADHILTTLWKVNDSKAGTLMKKYYENLQKGLGKSTALRQAKLDYLEESRLEGSHPFFWASFISIGDDEAMVLDKPWRGGWILVGLSIFVFLLLGIFSWRKKDLFDQWMSRRV